MADRREPPAARKSVPFAQVAAVTIGNALEFYDFLTFAFFAVYIARALFPGGRDAALLSALATFGVGFLTRPLGAAVLGPLGDRMGRRRAMVISIGLMGLGMAGLALTPSYARIGLAAPILAIIFRMTQGFALGGQVGPSTAFMLEAAPPERRGFYASLQYTSQGVASLLAALAGLALTSVLSTGEVERFGWRIAFGLGVAVVPVGLWLRAKLPETLHAAADATASARKSVRAHGRPIVLGFMLLTSGTIVTYVGNYVTTFALDTLKMPGSVAFGVNVMAGALGLVAVTIAGAWSDRIGRRPLLIWPTLAAIVAAPLAFWLIVHEPSVATLYGGMAVITILTNVNSAPVIIYLTESLPAHIRSGGVSLVYAFAISIFGGSTQFVVKYLLKVTGDHMVPGWYMTGALVVGLIAAVMVRESAPLKTGLAEAGAELVAEGAPAPG
ncbi:MAG TPA: MFS transporter [Caulobacteraceae bacterium]|nr:MFS transporter [Caulobacteraceae bacterium]